MRIQPFRAYRPPANRAERVASVPYDVIDRAGARRLAAGNPESFLHIVRPEIDLPAETSLHDDAVYAQAKRNFDAFIAAGTLKRDQEPGLYLYRLTMGNHQQSGIVATCHIDDYAQDVIKKHERTLQSKEDDRTRHVSTLNANAGPVFLTYPDHPGIDSVVAQTQAGMPLVDFVAPDGIRHEAWRIEDAPAIVDAFGGIPASYVADGHHRSASAARVGQERRDANPDHTGNEPYNWFLAVLFPASQLKVLAYNRVVNDLNGLTIESFLHEVRSRFTVSEDAAPVPEGPRHLCMYLDGRWYGLSWKISPADDPVSALDVSVLQDRLLNPVLGIDDPRTSDRIQFVGGIHGPEGLKAIVDEGSGAVAFSLYPTSVQQLMDIADAGQIMPPKSTWFEPKLRSGLFVHSLD